MAFFHKPCIFNDLKLYWEFSYSAPNSQSLNDRFSDKTVTTPSVTVMIWYDISPEIMIIRYTPTGFVHICLSMCIKKIFKKLLPCRNLQHLEITIISSDDLLCFIDYIDYNLWLKNDCLWFMDYEDANWKCFRPGKIDAVLFRFVFWFGSDVLEGNHHLFISRLRLNIIVTWLIYLTQLMSWINSIFVSCFQYSVFYSLVHTFLPNRFTWKHNYQLGNVTINLVRKNGYGIGFGHRVRVYPLLVVPSS